MLQVDRVQPNLPRYKTKITIQTLKSLRPDPKEDVWLWDDALSRFAFRMKPSGAGYFCIVYRNRQRRQRQLLVGRHGVVTPEQARAHAKILLAEVDAGGDPAETKAQDREAITVRELCELYLDAARKGLVKTRFGKPKRTSTIAIDEGRISRHIIPLIGNKLTREIRRSDIQKLVDNITLGKTAVTVKTKPRGVARVTGGPGTAARVVELFGGIWSWAQKRDLVAGPSPVTGVEKEKSQPKDRILSTEELKRLGEILKQNEVTHPHAVAALRLILLTGMRRQEVVELMWDAVDCTNSCIRLQETKTGRSTRPVGGIVFQILDSLPQINSFVFPSRNSAHPSKKVPDKPADLKKRIAYFFEEAGIPDARSHDGRRTFSSIADQLGYSDATIAELIGHMKRGVTQRHYVRRPDALLVKAADQVSNHIWNLLNSKIAKQSSPIRTVKKKANISKKLNYEKNANVKTPGRPAINPEKHPDALGVIMYDVQLRFAPLKVKKISSRYAAKLAAAAISKDGFKHTGPIFYKSPPTPSLVGSNLRKSPTKRALMDGYEEYTIMHTNSPENTEKYLFSAADRIRKLRIEWRKEPVKRKWLSIQSLQVASYVYREIPFCVLYRQHCKTL